jgi:mycothiol synthase
MDTERPTASVRRARDDDRDAILAVMEASFEVDDIPGITRGDLVRTSDRLPTDPNGAAVAFEGDRIVGYVWPRADDLTIHPQHRRRGHGRRLFAEALLIARERALPRLQLWVPKDAPASIAFAEAMGLRYRSSAWLFRLPAGVRVPPPQFPATVRTRTFTPAVNLAAYVDLMNASFENHPTPIRWTVEEVTHVHGLSSFSPDGILLVTPATDADQLIGFTRVELPGPGDEPEVGYIGLVGVHPDWRRLGIGRELLRWGVGYVREHGCGPVELGVEAENEGALGLYRATGFEPQVEWPHWVIDV